MKTPHLPKGHPDPNRRPDASMTLLTSMIQRPLDPGYAAAAARREAAGQPPATGGRSAALVAATIILGLLFATAALSSRTKETDATRARAQLIEQIAGRRAQVERQTAALNALQAEVTALDAQVLVGLDKTKAAQLQQLMTVSGGSAVHGPGFQVTLDDAANTNPNSADGNPRTTSDNTGKVIARDVQIVANSLWEAGAEAIAINGQRLTSLSAIRFAGDAILVDYRPLTRPYVLTAIGGPGRLPAAFAGGSGGTYLSTLRNSFGVRVSTSTLKEVTLPAASALQVREAVPGNNGAPTSTSTPTPGGSP